MRGGRGGETEQFGGVTSFLEKPFLAGELLDAVQRLLDAADYSQPPRKLVVSQRSTPRVSSRPVSIANQ